MDYDFGTLDPHDTSEQNTAALKAWLAAVQRGFHEPIATETHTAAWLAGIRADDQRTAGAWLPAGEFGAGLRPVGTFASFDKTLNAGLDVIGVHMITDITVSAAHRRRGLLRRLMVEDLNGTDAPVAALTATEGSIYGRFGFGAATSRRRIVVESTSKFAFASFVDSGRCELMEPEEMWPVISDLFTRFHATTRGSLERPHFYQPIVTGVWDPDTGTAATKLRGAVHLDPDGRPDGYAQWQVAERAGDTPASVNVGMLALNEDAHRGLWRLLVDLDLTERVVHGGSRMDDPLEWALVNSDVVDVKSIHHHIWIRVLDVPRALAARPWFADDDLVLGVDDPLGYAAGTFSITARGGRATVAPTVDAPDVQVSAETLGSLYLGGVSVGTLARAGRVTGTVEALHRLAALMDGGPAPYSATSF